jgi:hypothetical protein
MRRLLRGDSPESGRFASKPMFARSSGTSPSGSLAFGEPHGFAGSHTASPGATRLRREPHGFAGCKACRHQVEPATASLRAAEGAQVPIPPKWPNDTAPRLRFPIGASGSSVPVAGATMRILVVTGKRRRTRSPPRAAQFGSSLLNRFPVRQTGPSETPVAIA